MNSYKYVVSGLDKPMRVVDYLRVYCKVSVRLIKTLKRLENGIMLNGYRTRTIDFLNNKDVLEINLEPDKFEKKDRNLCNKEVLVVYEDDNFIVFNKPPNMPIHTSFNHQNGTLENVFYNHFGNLTYRPINRLDKDTSGLVLIAKNSHSAHFASYNVKKRYFFVVKGFVAEDNGIIEKPILRDDSSLIKRKVSDFGKVAITKYSVLKRFCGYTFLSAILVTGRTHQIRVHFSSLGFPLIGDSLYGGELDFINRQALHCGEMAFLSMDNGKEIALTSPLFFDIENAISYIENI